MDTYLSTQDYKATWTQQEIVNSERRPGKVYSKIRSPK